MIKRVKAFGFFWWDFLVGDAWELALAGVLTLGIAYALRDLPIAAAVAVPVSVMALLAVSAWFGRRR